MSFLNRSKLGRYNSSTRHLFNDIVVSSSDSEEKVPLLVEVHKESKDIGNTTSNTPNQTNTTLDNILRTSNRRQSSITFKDELRGAFICTLPFCSNYKLRIYLHYWLWQIPIFILNIILFCIWNITHKSNHPLIALQELGYLAVSPVLMSVLVRDKIFLWAVYWLVKKTVRLPCNCCTQQNRYHISRLADCIGGLHSSAGVSAFIWNIIYCVGCFIREDLAFNWRTGTALSLPTLLVIICISAFPCIRHYFHNSFEILHRYLGWICLSLLITHVTLVNIYRAPDVLTICTNATTIFTFSILVLTIYPWVIMHRVKGRDIEIVCAKQSTAYIFPFNAPMGAVCKMSTDFMEFHIMGITPLGDGRSFALVKSLGDWTNALNDRAKIEGALDDVTFYVTRIKPPNFTQGLFNWDRVFVLVTGSGIAPLIPYLINPLQKPVISLVWIARDHANNYPKFIIEKLEGVPNVVLYDTTKMPRPNLSTLCLEYVKDFGAEAVFLVSNPSLAYGVSNVITKHGIPVFASNFDV